MDGSGDSNGSGDSDGSGDSEVTIEVGKSTNKLSFDLDKEACEIKGAWLQWFRCHTHPVLRLMAPSRVPCTFGLH